jgi:predicted Zn-dependent protease
MSIEAFLDLIRQRFSPPTGKIILKSLNHDPLVWQFVQDKKKSLPYFESSPNEIHAFSPGSIAKWLIEQEMGLSLPALDDLSQKLPDKIRQRAAKEFNTVLNSGLPPIDLLNAGLLALTLRERRLIQNSWKGISEELIINQRSEMRLKYFQTWRTPFACLFSFSPKFGQVITDFSGSQNSFIIKVSIPLFLHSVLANPKPPESLLDELFAFAKALSIQNQLECLQWLENFERNTLRKSLARNLMQTKSCQTYFAEIFSELEGTDNKQKSEDPLEKHISFSLPERLNQLAAFHYHSGDQAKAIETYHQSCDLMNTIQSQTRFQALYLQGFQAPPSAWLKLIQNLPDSQQAHLFHIQSMIERGNLQEAKAHLTTMPDSEEKKFLGILLQDQQEIKIDENPTAQKALGIPPLENLLPIAEHYIRRPDFIFPKELVGTIGKITDPKEKISIIKQILKSNYKGSSFLIFARDEFENIGDFDHAIEIGSYLERIEHKEINHQRALARLYAKSLRWQDSFSLHQEMIRSISKPNISDLEAFAESALMIGRVDLAISICQNILKDDKSNSKALILLGKGYLEKGDIVKAIQHMEQVVATIPDDPQTWVHLARFWESSGQTDRAFEILRQGTLAIPNDPQLLHEIGKAHLENASPTEARNHLRKAFEITPSNNTVRHELAEAEYQLGNYAHSYKLLEPIIDDFHHEQSISKLFGNVLLALGENDRAEPILLSVAQHNPADLQTVLTVSDLLLTITQPDNHHNQIQKLEILEDILEKAIENHPNNTHLKLYQTDLDRLKGRNQKAYDSYTQLAKINQNQKDLPNWRIQFGLGLSSIPLGEIEIGLAALEDASLTQPGNIDILHALAKTYNAADLQDKALACAQNALQTAPEDIENLIWYGKFNAENNQFDQAMRAFEDAAQLAPERLDLKLLCAKTLITIDSIENAVDQLDDLLTNENIKFDEYHQIAYLYIQAQQLNRAAIALDKANDKCEQLEPVILMDRAVLKTLVDQRKNAIELLDLPEESLKNYPPLGMLKASLLSEIGQYPQALQYLNLIEDQIEDWNSKQQPLFAGIAQSPLLYRYDFSLNGYFFQRGQLMRTTGKLDLAKSLIKKATETALNRPKFQNALVGVSIASLDFEEALHVLEANNPLESNSGDLDLNQIDLICSHGEILLEQNELELANKVINHQALINRNHPRLLAIQSRLAALDGDLPQASDYLGDAIEAYHQNFNNINPTTPSELFRIQTILQSIANAYLELEDYQTALDYQQASWAMMNSQPNINLCYIQLIIHGAEKHQIAKEIKLTKHAPTPQFLEEGFFHLGKNLINDLKNVLSDKDWLCLNARFTSAFTGKWPKQCQVDSCLNTPLFGAAYILGGEDETRVREIVTAFPESLPVLQASAIFTLKTGQGNGENSVKKALQIDTANPINHALMGFVNIKDPELALKSFETALQFWPEEPEWQRILSDLYTKLGDVDKATEHITKAIESQPENNAYRKTRAGLLLKMNRLEQAKVDLMKSTQLQSQDAETWLSVSKVNRRLGNIMEATENLQMAVKLKPDNYDIAAKEISFLLDQGRYQEAEAKASKKLQEIGNNKNIQILLARSRAKLGNFELAIETLLNARMNEQEDPDIALEIIKIKKDQTGVEKSLPQVIQLAQNHPEHPEILKTLTDWLIQTKRLSEAQETAQTILRIIPESAEVQLMLGRLQRLNGQLDQAIAHLSDAISHDPDLIDAYIELGKTYADRKNLEEAIKIFQMGATIDASDPRPYYHTGMALKSCKDYAGAEAMLKQAKKYAPGDANIIRQLGVITALNLINNLRETS